MINSEILMIEKLGCLKPIAFNLGIQQVNRAENVIAVAEMNRLAMFQGKNGYVEVWIDDQKNYCCQVTNFGAEKYGSVINAICVVDESSLQIGNKASAEAWLEKREKWLAEEKL